MSLLESIEAPIQASFSRARNTVIERFMELKVVRLADAFAQRKFWMLPKTVHVMVSECSLRNGFGVLA